MTKYIAFLRGINVGGKNKVPMPELKILIEQNGFVDVVTYINSGNVIFSSDRSDVEEIKKECEAFIEDKFSFRIPVAIVPGKDLLDALDNAPSWWNKDEDSKHNAIFVIPPVTVDEVFKDIGTAKPEYEKVDFYGRVIFWSAPIETFSRTRWSKVTSSSLYDKLTIRNANTVNKLALLIK